MPLPTRELQEDPYLYAFAGRTQPRTLDQSIGATIEDPRSRPTQELSEYQQQEPDKFSFLTQSGGPLVQGYASGIQAYNSVFGAAPEPSKPVDMLSPEQVKQEFGHLGVKFDTPTPRRAVELTAQRRQDDMHREEIIAASPQSLAAKGVRFGAGLLGAAVDPLNIAATFIPVIGEENFARIAAQTSVNAARVASGAASGAVGTAAFVAPAYAMSRQLQLDYSMSDALLNVAFGTILGGGLHVMGGAIADRLGKSAGPPTATGGVPGLTPEPALAASPEALEGALRGAVAQFAEGKPVDIAPIFAVDESLRQASAEKGTTTQDLSNQIQGMIADVQGMSDRLQGRNRTPLTQDETATALEPHMNDIQRMAQPATDWPVPPPPAVEPKTEFGLKEAQEFDTETIKRVEEAMMQARDVGTEPPKPPAAIEKANENVSAANAWQPAMKQLAHCLSIRG